MLFFSWINMPKKLVVIILSRRFVSQVYLNKINLNKNEINYIIKITLTAINDNQVKTLISS